MPKKTKSIKLSDRKGNKPWLKRAIPSQYAIETRETRKTILIVAEGQTEKLYFKSFPVLSLTVEVIDFGGQSKLKLIDSTTAFLENSSLEFDIVWCVFDMDHTQGEKEFSDFDNAIVSGESKGYKIAYSNDSFELWFYLHYQFTEQKNHRNFYYQSLGNQWDLNYEKFGKNFRFCQSIYAKLKDDSKASQEKATERAEKLFLDQKHLSFHKQNPVTKVFELVRFLNENSRK